MKKTVRYYRPPKCKGRFHSPVTTKSYDDEESLVENNFNGCMDTINIYFKQVEKGEEEIIQVNHAKDSLILVLLWYNGKERLKITLSKYSINYLLLRNTNQKLNIVYYFTKPIG